MTEFTIPGLTDTQSRKIADLLQSQLSTYNDLHLTLKHVHWNVVGPNFIGVHEMLDPQVELVRGMRTRWPNALPHSEGLRRARLGRFSRTAHETTTRWAVTRCRLTWPRWIWCIPE